MDLKLALFACRVSSLTVEPTSWLASFCVFNCFHLETHLIQTKGQSSLIWRSAYVKLLLGVPVFHNRSLMKWTLLLSCRICLFLYILFPVLDSKHWQKFCTNYLFIRFLEKWKVSKFSLNMRLRFFFFSFLEFIANGLLEEFIRKSTFTKEQ